MAEQTRNFLSHQLGRLARRALNRHSYALVPFTLLIILFVVNALVQHQFVAQSNWAGNMAVLFPLLMTGVALALPVLTGNGGIDLSVGPLSGFVSVLVSTVLLPAGIRSPWLIVPIVLLFGAISGSITGILIAVVRLPPIIATLGMYLFYEGMGTQVLPQAGGKVPSWLITINGSIGPIPGVWLVIAAFVVVWFAICRTSFLRNVLAIGGDDRAAYTAGVNIVLVRIAVYALTSVIACLAGLMLTGLIQGGDGTVGPPYTISAITAVALGGISLAGGRGGLLGAAFGGGVLFLIQELLTDANVNVYQVSVVDGIILIAALALNGTVEYFRRRVSRTAVNRPGLIDAPSPELGSVAEAT